MKDKREHLIATAIRLIAAEGASIPTARIAKEAGVSNGTLFNYFPTKQILLDDVYLSIKKDVAEYVLRDLSQDMSAKEVMFGIWQRYILWACDNLLRHKVGIFLRGSMVLSEEVCAQADAIFMLKIDKIREGVETGQLLNLPVSYICDLSNAQIAVAIAFIEQNKLDKVDLGKHIHRSFDVFWNGISAS
jgi:AcrR family transcriptional regulator